MGTHILAHQDFPETQTETYKEKMAFLFFDEGLAHFLAMNQDAKVYNWTSEENLQRKRKALQQFSEALQEEDNKIQNHLLIAACSGSFWNKFACIAGMFQWADIYLKSGIAGLTQAYHAGWRAFAETEQDESVKI